MLKGLLEAQGFTVLISGEAYKSALGISGPPFGNTQILVPLDQSEDARKVIADYHAGKFEESADEN